MIKKLLCRLFGHKWDLSLSRDCPFASIPCTILTCGRCRRIHHTSADLKIGQFYPW
jgi:hypothetical protein